jgi:hypothetical protein
MYGSNDSRSRIARTIPLMSTWRFEVIGQWSATMLSPREASRAEAPERVSHGLAAHPIGVIVLARLAVDITQQGQGLGTTLLQDALTRSEQAADTVGVRAVLVHAIDGFKKISD